MLSQLKQKLYDPKNTRNEMIQILTVLPLNEWNVIKAAKKLDVSRFIIKKAKRLLSEKRVLSHDEKKTGQKLFKNYLIFITNIILMNYF